MDDRGYLGGFGGSPGRNFPVDAKSHPTAVEWVKTVPLDCPHPDARELYVCYGCAAANLDAYARQRVEAFRERVVEWLDNEDKAGDPDDLYTGRCHRIAAIQALEL